jgi:hypothetical protein
MEAVKREEGDAALMQRASEGTYAKVRFSPSGLVALWPCGLLPLGLSDTLSTPRRGKKIAGLKFLIAAFHKS